MRSRKFIHVLFCVFVIFLSFNLIVSCDFFNPEATTAASDDDGDSSSDDDDDDSSASDDDDDDDDNSSNNKPLYTIENLPNKFGVVLPKSLSSTESAESIVEPASRAEDIPDEVNVDGDSDVSEAYRELTEDIDIVREFMKDIEIEMMMLDSKYEEIMDITESKSGSIPANTLTITYTESMETRIEELYDIEIDIVGETEDVPALELTIFESDAAGDGYKYKIVYDNSYTESGEAVDYEVTVKWNSDKTKVYIKREKSMTMGGEGFEGSTATDDYIISSYDSASNTGILEMNFKTTQDLSPQNSIDAYKIILRETGNENNEVYIDSVMLHTDEITSTIIRKKIGRCDDNDGAVKMDTYNWEGAKGYKETFSADGGMLLQSTSDDGIIYTGDDISDDFTLYELDSTVLTLTGFDPSENGVYYLQIVEGDAPDYNSNLSEFLGATIGFIVFEKSSSGSEVTDSFYWGTEAQLTDAKIWQEYFNSLDDNGFTELTSVTATLPSE